MYDFLAANNGVAAPAGREDFSQTPGNRILRVEKIYAAQGEASEPRQYLSLGYGRVING